MCCSTYQAPCAHRNCIKQCVTCEMLNDALGLRATAQNGYSSDSAVPVVDTALKRSPNFWRNRFGVFLSKLWTQHRQCITQTRLWRLHLFTYSTKTCFISLVQHLRELVSSIQLSLSTSVHVLPNLIGWCSNISQSLDAEQCSDQCRINRANTAVCK
jgi:hypothetical protein